MALFNKNGSLDARNEAPENSGALLVNEDAKKIPPGKVKSKKVKPDIVISFHLPHAPDGKCNVCIPVPVVNENGELTPEITHQQITLEDGFYTPPKKEQKNTEIWTRFCKLMKDEGWHQHSSILNREELRKYREEIKNKPMTKKEKKRVQKIFGCFNPEHLTSELTFAVSFQFGDIVRTFQMIRGRLFTNDIEIHKIWLKNGFEDIGYVKDSQKISQEISPEITEDKDEDEDYQGEK